MDLETALTLVTVAFLTRTVTVTEVSGALVIRKPGRKGETYVKRSNAHRFPLRCQHGEGDSGRECSTLRFVGCSSWDDCHWGALRLRHGALLTHQRCNLESDEESTYSGCPVCLRLAAEITVIRMDFPFLPVLSEAHSSRAIEWCCVL